jgi:hypothetical protein
MIDLLIFLPLFFVVLAVLLRRNKLIFFCAVILFAMNFRLMGLSYSKSYLVQIDLLVVMLELFAIFFLYITAKKRFNKNG